MLLTYVTTYRTVYSRSTLHGSQCYSIRDITFSVFRCTSLANHFTQLSIRFEFEIEKVFHIFSKSTWDEIKLVSFYWKLWTKNWSGKIEKESQQELTIHCLNWMCLYACEWVCACIDFERWNSRFLGFSCWNSCNPAHTEKSHRLSYGWEWI